MASAQPAAPAATTSTQSAETTLADSIVELGNGLRVLIQEVPAAEHVCILVRYRVGEAHDPAGQSGMAHLAEHLYVTAATDDTPARDANEYMERYPIGWNAQTYWDATVFAVVVTPDRLEAELADAAARMGGLNITDEDLEREIPRVEQELNNMYGGMPMLAAPNHARMHVLEHPATTRRGGVNEQVAAIEVEQIRDWIQRHHLPQNAVLAVVGPVDEAATLERIEVFFEPIPNGSDRDSPIAAASIAPWREPTQGEIGIERVSGPVNNAVTPAKVAMALATPRPDDDATYAAFLTLVARWWSQSPAENITVIFAPIDGPEAVTFTTTCGPGESAEAALDRIDTFVESTCGEPLGVSEPIRARTMLGNLFGTSPMGDALLAQNVYLLAFRNVTLIERDIDSTRLRDAWIALDETTFAQVVGDIGARPRARVVFD